MSTASQAKPATAATPIPSVEPMIRSLNKLPNVLPLYARALLNLRRQAAPDATVVPTEVRVSGVRIDAGRLAAYREVCGFAPSDELPITYPQVLATPLHVLLMTQPEFPFPLLGLVHLRNRNQVFRPLKANGRYEVRASIGPGRRIPNALIFDLKAEFIDESGEVACCSITTPLVRLKVDSQRGGKMPEPTMPPLEPYQNIEVPENIGRRYGWVSRDFNPIHMHARTARLFGFNQAIAHGMWSVARCAAAMSQKRSTPPALLTVQYRAPLMLPSSTVLKCLATEQGHEFGLYGDNGEGGERLYLNGALS